MSGSELPINDLFKTKKHTITIQKPDLKIKPLQFVNGWGSRSLTSVPMRMFWHSFRETTGTAGAVLKIQDGADTNAFILATISLYAGESTRDDFGDYGISAEHSLYVNLVSGTVEGIIGAVSEVDYALRNKQTITIEIPDDGVESL